MEVSPSTLHPLVSASSVLLRVNVCDDVCVLMCMCDLCLWLDKGKPAFVVDGSSEKGFKKWRKHTVHPMYITKVMTANELLVSPHRTNQLGQSCA